MEHSLSPTSTLSVTRVKTFEYEIVFFLFFCFLGLWAFLFLCFQFLCTRWHESFGVAFKTAASLFCSTQWSRLCPSGLFNYWGEPCALVPLSEPPSLTWPTLSACTRWFSNSREEVSSLFFRKRQDEEPSLGIGVLGLWWVFFVFLLFCMPSFLQWSLIKLCIKGFPEGDLEKRICSGKSSWPAKHWKVFPFCQNKL